MIRFAILLTLVLSLGGCKVTEEAISTAQTSAAACDRYTTLVVMSLDGETTLKSHGIASVNSADLASASTSVTGLINALLEALHVNRLAWHSELFQLNEGKDPATMDLTQVKIELPEDGENK